MADLDDERGAWLSDLQWGEICERGKFHCSECKEVPDVSDIDIFLDDGICGDCAARNRRIYESD